MFGVFTAAMKQPHLINTEKYIKNGKIAKNALFVKLEVRAITCKTGAERAFCDDCPLCHHQRRRLLDSGVRIWPLQDLLVKIIPGAAQRYSLSRQLRAALRTANPQRISKLLLPLKTLSLKGAVVTIDAMGCQKKSPKPSSRKRPTRSFRSKKTSGILPLAISTGFREKTSGPDLKPSLRLFASGMSTEKTSTETVYLIPSLENHNPTIAKVIRDHWGIENSLQWCLDVAFREGHCRVRKDHGPENFAILRHMAINLLKRETFLKRAVSRPSGLRLHGPQDAC